jgi:hypothetical protein
VKGNCNCIGTTCLTFGSRKQNSFAFFLTFLLPPSPRQVMHCHWATQLTRQYVISHCLWPVVAGLVVKKVMYNCGTEFWFVRVKYLKSCMSSTDTHRYSVTKELVYHFSLCIRASNAKHHSWVCSAPTCGDPGFKPYAGNWLSTLGFL